MISLAAHYGSVSVATFAVGVAFLADRGVDYDTQLPLFLVLLEVPAIVVGILIARRGRAGGGWGKLLHEIFFRPEGEPAGRRVRDGEAALLLGWIVFVWSRELWGPVGGTLSLFLYCLSPTMLATRLPSE